MRIGSLQNSQDVIRELLLLQAVKLTTNSVVVENSVATASTDWEYYPSASLSVATQSGDLAEINFVVSGSTSGYGVKFNVRVVRISELSSTPVVVGRARSFTDVSYGGVAWTEDVPSYVPSGDDHQMDCWVRDFPPKGNNRYQLQWRTTGAAGTLSSAGAEIFIKVYSTPN